MDAGIAPDSCMSVHLQTNRHLLLPIEYNITNMHPNATMVATHLLTRGKR
jgi:hypothetical protein